MNHLTTFLLILLSTVGFSQDRPLAVTQLDSQQMDADEFVGFDKFGYYYFIKNNALIKWKNGETVEYKNVATGKMTRVDIENPLLVVLFYEPFNTIVLLDNQLNEVRKINFNDLNVPIVAHAAGLASQNKLWIYDSLTQQVGLYDYLTNDYRAITTPLKENFKYYQTDFNYFRWIDMGSRQYATDIFGKVANLGTVEQAVSLQFISGTQILCEYSGGLHLVDWQKGTDYLVTGVEKSFKKFYYKDQILAIFTGEGITNYKITIP